MPKFEVATPDGKKFEIEAPDAQSASETLDQYLATQGGAAQPSSGAAPAPVAGDNWQPPGAIVPIQFPADMGTNNGQPRLAMPQMLSSAIDAFKLPGDVMSGKENFDPRLGLQGLAPSSLERADVAAGFMTPGMTPSRPGAVVSRSSGQNIPPPIRKALDRSGIDPRDAAGMVSRLGPEGRLIDIDDNLQLLGAAQGNVMGAARSTITQEMRLRAAGGNDRIKGALNAELGPAPNPTSLKETISAAQDALGPVYERELALGQMAVDLNPLRRNINNQMLSAKGKSVSALNTISRMLYRNDDPETLETAPAALLRARNAIDGMISTEADSTVVRNLTIARKQIDDMLGNAVPGIKAVDAQYAELASQSGAIDTGTRILNNGPEAVTPDDLGNILNMLAGPKGTMVGPRAAPSEAPLRLSQGTRALLDRVVGTSANDRVKLRQLIAGDGSWNYQKLGQVFGKEKADNIMQVLANEARMAESENLVLHGSRTAPLIAAQEDLGLTGASKAGVVQNALNLKPGDAAAKALDNIFGGMLRRRREATSARTAESLMGRGEFDIKGARVGAFGGPTPLPAIQQMVAPNTTMLPQNRGPGMMPQIPGRIRLET